MVNQLNEIRWQAETNAESFHKCFNKESYFAATTNEMAFASHKNTRENCKFRHVRDIAYMYTLYKFRLLGLYSDVKFL